MKMTAIAIFASGRGTNALNLIKHFEMHEKICVSVLICNKSDAEVVQNARNLGVEVLIFDNQSFESGLTVLQELDYRAIDWIILAGFLRKIPLNMIRNYPNKIINIHPSLLPKFGGKGMYGKHVHEVVLTSNETETGISIHLVDEEFDSGEILAQYKFQLEKTDNISSISEKIQALEQKYFPSIVEQTLIKQ